MKKLMMIICLLLLSVGCNEIQDIEVNNPIKENPIDVVQKEPIEIDVKETNYTLHKEGITIEERYPSPEGYIRTPEGKESFGEFLRVQKLKPYGEKVKYFDGREKNHQGVYDSVFDVEIGDRDLHQCADAIMLLRAEYLYGQGRYSEISFSFVSGFKAEYGKWVEGYRIKVDGNNASYYKATSASDSYESFRKYMNMVMAYASTLSLEKEMENVELQNMQIGDVFILGGSPGHGIIIVDMAIDSEGDKVFLLAQSYMPAQQTQILINPMDKNLSPWYSVKDKEKLITPEWKFELSQLKRFR